MKRIVLGLAALSLTLMGGPLSGKRAASFTLPDSTGKFYDLLDYRGKVVLIDIMRTDCPHCVTLSKTLERVKAKYGIQVQVISIVNPPDTPQKVSDFIARYRITSPIVFDCGQAAAALLRITPQNTGINLPQLLVVDQQGMVREDWVYDEKQPALNPIFDGDGLFPVLDKLLKPQAPAKK